MTGNITLPGYYIECMHQKFTINVQEVGCQQQWVGGGVGAFCDHLEEAEKVQKTVSHISSSLTK